MKYLYFSFMMFLFIGCSRQLNLEKQDELLSHKLISLNNSIDKKQAFEISNKILQVSKEIKDEFNPVPYPWINNTLVNLGIKEKGLCWEWRDELYKRLNGNIEPFAILKIGANVGKLNEHNAIAIISKSNDIQNSILIDLWRCSGVPYIVTIKDDNSYIWSRREIE